MMDGGEQPKYSYAHPRPMVTVDAVVFTVRDDRLEVLVIRRKRPPFQGMWALPGGFVEMDEDLGDAVRRELFEETGVAGIGLEQFHTFGKPGRDPRGRIITVAYFGVADWRGVRLDAADDAEDAAWLSVEQLPQLASDHNDIVEKAVTTLDRSLARHAFDPLSLPETVSTDDLRGAVTRTKS